jgi:hypothetical protein
LVSVGNPRGTGYVLRKAETIAKITRNNGNFGVRVQQASNKARQRLTNRAIMTEQYLRHSRPIPPATKDSAAFQYLRSGGTVRDHGDNVTLKRGTSALYTLKRVKPRPGTTIAGIEVKWVQVSEQ